MYTCILLYFSTIKLYNDTTIQRYYYINISHLSFENEEEAIKVFKYYLTANLITPEVYYNEKYIMLEILIEYIPEGSDHTELQFYLDHLTKPK